MFITDEMRIVNEQSQWGEEKILFQLLRLLHATLKTKVVVITKKYFEWNNEYMKQDDILP